MGKRIFAGDWRACQEEHLRAVVAAGDARNEASLVQVLQDIGFDAVRLAALGIPADIADAVEASMESPAPAAAETGDPPAAASDEVVGERSARPAGRGRPPWRRSRDRSFAGDEGHDEGEEGDDGDAAPAQLSLF
ncbi:MAG: hypothetical protein OXB89_10310 [Anaerolineaceae bacterium]|nr:hypothetical protein [Anaerolineaceae bacterium]